MVFEDECEDDRRQAGRILWKKKNKRVSLRERQRLRRCGNGDVNENVTCLRKLEGLH